MRRRQDTHDVQQDSREGNATRHGVTLNATSSKSSSPFSPLTQLFLWLLALMKVVFSLLGAFVFIPLTLANILLSIVLPSKAIVWAHDAWCFSFYQYFILSFVEVVTGMRLRWHGDKIIPKRNGVIFSNHQSWVDWTIIEIISGRKGRLGDLRFTLRESDRLIPLYGRYFYYHGFIFVRRGWESDIAQFQKQLRFLKNNKLPVWLAIFPEGQRYDFIKRPHLLEESHKFCEERGLEKFTQLITPRFKGLSFILQEMEDCLDDIYDITIRYRKRGGPSAEDRALCATEFRPPPPSLLDIILRRYDAVDICVRIHSAKDVCASFNTAGKQDEKARDAAAQSWLMNVYKEKEEILKYYNDHGTFPPSYLPYDEPYGWRSIFYPLLYAFIIIVVFCFSPTARNVTLLCSLLYGVVGWIQMRRL